MGKVARLRGGQARAFIGEFMGYTAASAVALAVDVGTLVFLVSQGMHYLVAAAIAFFLGLIIVYLASIWWIFSWRSYKERRHFEIGFFLFTAAVGLGINLGIMWFGTSVLGFYYLIPKAASVVLVFSWNFLSRKAMLFTPAV